MSCDTVVQLLELGKTYHVWSSPASRLAAALGFPHSPPKSFVALEPITISISAGEVVGLVGRNGAGKSTLLQCVAGTVTPSVGSCTVNGRLAALLELGAGFQPQLSGRENIQLYGALLGMKKAEVDSKRAEIIQFSELGQAIDQPISTYSSGMIVRLAFAIATSSEPDILLVDEALSVGDGAFARKSFDRVLELKDRGVAILLCSHSLYQIETLCDRALWIHNGAQESVGKTRDVTEAYKRFLDAALVGQHRGDSTAFRSIDWSEVADSDRPDTWEETQDERMPPSELAVPTLVTVVASVNGVVGNDLTCISGKSDIKLIIEYRAPEGALSLSIAVTFHDAAGQTLTSCSTEQDGISTKADGDNVISSAELCIPACPFTHGSVAVSVHLMCERGLHVYESADHAVIFQVEQLDRIQGKMRLPHFWSKC